MNTIISDKLSRIWAAALDKRDTKIYWCRKEQELANQEGRIVMCLCKQNGCNNPEFYPRKHIVRSLSK